MKISTICIAAIFTIAGVNSGFAQDPDTGDTIEDDFEEVEELLIRRKEKRKPINPNRMPNGPVTAISSAALLFAGFDSDTDYTVDKTEFEMGRKRAFERADENGNGIISLFELETWRGRALGTLDATPGNMSFDQDFDNRVTQAEFDDMLERVFMRNDKDKDGNLTFSEMVTIFEMPDMDAFEDRLERDILSRQRTEQAQRR